MNSAFAIELTVVIFLASGEVAAAIEVRPSTGSLGSEQLARIDEAVEQVVGEADEREGEWTIVAEGREEGDLIAVTVTLSRSTGGDPIVARRAVSIASLETQVRAMAREVLGRPAEKPVEPLVLPKNDEASQVVQAPFEPRYYDRTTALALSFVPMVTLIVTGTVLHVGAFAWATWKTESDYFVSGIVVATTGVVLGPLPGYLYLGLKRRAFAMAGLRFGLALTTAGFAGLGVSSMCGSTDEPCSDSRRSQTRMSAIMLTLSFSAAAVVGVIEAAFAGRLADRANERERSRVAAFLVAPTVLRAGPRGGATPGVVFAATF